MQQTQTRQNTTIPSGISAMIGELASWTGASLKISRNPEGFVVSLDTDRFELKINGDKLAGTAPDLNGALSNLDWKLRGATVDFFLKDSGEKEGLRYVDSRG